MSVVLKLEDWTVTMLLQEQDGPDFVLCSCEGEYGSWNQYIHEGSAEFELYLKDPKALAYIQAEKAAKSMEPAKPIVTKDEKTYDVKVPDGKAPTAERDKLDAIIEAAKPSVSQAESITIVHDPVK